MSVKDLKNLANLFIHGVVSYLALHLPDVFADGEADHVAISAGAAALVMVLRAAADMLEKRDKS